LEERGYWTRCLELCRPIPLNLQTINEVPAPEVAHSDAMSKERIGGVSPRKGGNAVSEIVSKAFHDRGHSIKGTICKVEKLTRLKHEISFDTQNVDPRRAYRFEK